MLLAICVSNDHRMLTRWGDERLKITRGLVCVVANNLQISRKGDAVIITWKGVFVSLDGKRQTHTIQFSGDIDSVNHQIHDYVALVEEGLNMELESNELTEIKRS